jgi:hypothetical protein
MDGNLARLAVYLENLESQVKVVREQAEAIIQDKMKKELAAFSEDFIMLLASKKALT